MIRKLCAIALSAAILSGCSSIVSKSEYSVAINSSPESASFVVTNAAGLKVHSGRTPASVTLKSSAGYFEGESYTITLNKDGYAPKMYTMTSSVDGWYYGNILFGGLIGMLIVDPATGAMYNLPDRVDVSLDQSVANDKNDSITVATIDSLTGEQIKRLKKI